MDTDSEHEDKKRKSSKRDRSSGSQTESDEEERKKEKMKRELENQVRTLSYIKQSLKLASVPTHPPTKIWKSFSIFAFYLHIIHANPSNFKVSECLFFTDRIKQGSRFDVILM